MIENDEVLETMQADILGMLENTPSLKGHVFKDNEGDFQSRLEKSLGTKTAGSTGKRGLAIIVLQVDVTEAEKNLPGPPLKLRVRVLMIENIVVNRSATKGTLQRSSQAAVNVLSTLQLSGFGGYSVYADKGPIAPQTVPDGLSSHLVTLYVQSGLNPVSKPLGVEAAMNAGVLTLACASAGASVYYTTDGTYPTPASGTLATAVVAAAKWKTVHDGNATSIITAGDLSVRAYGWDGSNPFNDFIGEYPVPVATTESGMTTEDIAAAIVAVLQAQPDVVARLTITRVGKLIYTENVIPGYGSGGYPQIEVQDGTAETFNRDFVVQPLVTGTDASTTPVPITGLATGTVVRAAAYVTGMPPGDVLELTVTA